MLLTVKAIPIKDSSWPENRENVHTFPSAVFLRLSVCIRAQKYFFCLYASDSSFLGYSHTGLHFIDEEQKRLACDFLDTSAARANLVHVADTDC